MPMAFREPNEVKWVGIRPAHKGEQVTIRGCFDTEEGVLYTVPSGKTFYLTHFNHSLIAFTGGHRTAEVRVRNASDITQYILTWLGRPSEAPGSEANSGSLNPPLEIPAGWDIYLFASVGARSHFFAHGFLE